VNDSLFWLAILLYWGILILTAGFPYFIHFYQKLVWDNPRRIYVDEILVSSAMVVVGIACWIASSWVIVTFVTILGEGYLGMRNKMKNDQESKERMK